MNQENETHPADEDAQATVDAQEQPESGPEVEDAADDTSVEALLAQISELKEDVLRTQAAMENQRKRHERDLEGAHKYGTERLINELLPVKDSLDLGLMAAQTANDVTALREGLELTAKMFGDFLEKLALVPIDPLGERFDPERHQAMTMEASVEVEPGNVLRVMQRGYLLHDRLLRPALVVVAKAADES